MRLRKYLGLLVFTLLLGAGVRAQEAGLFEPAAHEPRSQEWGNTRSFGYASPLLYAQGWNSYGYGNPYLGSQYYQPYNQTPHFSYLYFYEQYAREAEESRRAADEYEASLAREGKLTGPLEVGAFPTDFLPRAGLKLQLTLDGGAVAPSPSGAPLVIESGEHTLTIGTRDEAAGD